MRNIIFVLGATWNSSFSSVSSRSWKSNSLAAHDTCMDSSFGKEVNDLEKSSLTADLECYEGMLKIMGIVMQKDNNWYFRLKSTCSSTARNAWQWQLISNRNRVAIKQMYISVVQHWH